MLLANDLDEQETEKSAMWELFADLMDFDTDFKFTAKELSQELPYTKQELNKLLFRLYTNKTLQIIGKTPSGATIYKLRASFQTGEPTED